MISLKQITLPVTLGSVLLMNIGMTSAQEANMPLFLNEALDKAQADNPALRAAGIQRQLQQARIEQGCLPRALTLQYLREICSGEAISS